MSGRTYIAANGQEITDEMIDRWCEAYERGEFPVGEHTAGCAVHGRPPLSDEGSAVLSVKVPLSMKKAIERRAGDEGVSTSVFVRDALADKLAKVG